MACSCGSTAHTDLVREGSGISVTGSGTPENPYIITSDAPEFAQRFRVRDTPTVNMTMTGSGTEDDPYEVRAESTLKLSQLADVQDPQGGPSIGESPVWTGAGAAGHWEFKTLPPAPAGAVNVSTGLTGLGSVDNPLKVAVSGTWGTGALASLGSDSTIGQLIYVDSAGKVRTAPISTINWSQVAGKPETFPPSQHSHVASDISAAEQLKLNVGKINGRKITAHSSSSTLPTTGTSALDLAFFPKGT